MIRKTGHPSTMSSIIDQMERCFKHFYDGYAKQYPLSQAERDVVNVLYNIIRPFRWD
ncbi:hypothetical protein [Paenibacillus thiaminolyticus]|uniref:hypothetical protein n=1 Tax=Paenibacillus thiaminolyticus TaxID=49283 RepID=UPI0016022D8C|nr:hypothetical protein [Paenibacillus thiaminolyticus]